MWKKDPKLRDSLKYNPSKKRFMRRKTQTKFSGGVRGGGGGGWRGGGGGGGWGVGGKAGGLAGQRMNQKRE